VPGDPDAGHRRRHPGIQAVRPEPHHQPHAGLRAAHAFRPARRRVQNLVDRHFNRRRYDAAQTIQVFAARLRQQPDLDLLARDLLAVVDQTMEPTNAALWLVPGPE
jgi:hypothetical protein